ncbi:Phytochrome-like protein cph2 [Sporotomaculum syntrophicum]|uniref:Stage 0 sporulation protein A homolog n=1 Tax=Sporotomaculum syntrophicum TaxID=182264 RepID=A0A9D3AWM9_9FIRM|nr:EAL domain-containing protein [Sporotomaculum syntrophicum]KAF1084012.1 Phytochrome-like protein cph2 [Sporotomaculum syntrophicum]
MIIKILVVDDSASDRLIIKNMLSEYCILTACDGVEAMQALEEHDGINLLILVLNMPNMNGFQVLESLKKNERFSKLRTIILTNNDELDNEIKGLKLGAVDYIRKPIQFESLKARIDVHVALLRAKQELEQNLDEQAFNFDMIFEQSLIGIAISLGIEPEHSSDTIVKINSMFEQITGRTKEELIKLGWAKITHPDDLEEDLVNFRKLQAGEIKSYTMEKRFIKPKGSIVWVYMIVAALAPPGKIGFEHICFIKDISDRKQIENELRYINEHNRLTGLYNRDYLEARLKNDTKQKKRSKRALIGINLSTVQLLTANFGFLYTQDLIKQAAEALSRYCTDNRLLFQTAENRFLFYLADYKDKKELDDFSKTIEYGLESLFAAERMGGGIGILEIDENQDKFDLDLLMRRLLIASEKSINMSEGGNFKACFYDEELESLINRERDIMEALFAIVADDDSNDELFLQYQPILNLKKGSICCFEVLARLKTQKLGLVSPVEFIPIAEKTKCIIQIGDKVIAGAFYFLNKLKEHGYVTISVSINVSVFQLLRPDFTSRLFEMITAMQVNPENICIEITESAFISDYEIINHIIDKLKDYGLRIAIDDFGTGYSSLAREKELKVDYLKVDKYFIDKLLDTDPDKAITSDIISMAHKLGHCAIAEGVEHKCQLQYLKEHGCDNIQGYFISKPLNEDDAFEFLEGFCCGY